MAQLLCISSSDQLDINCGKTSAVNSPPIVSLSTKILTKFTLNKLHAVECNSYIKLITCMK